MKENLIMCLISYWIMLMALYIPKITYNKNEYFDDYLSLENCQKIKGLSCIMVLMCHLSNCLLEPSNVYLILVKHILTKFGFLSVCVFLYISGYGLMKKYQIRKNYLKNFLSKRLFSILIPFLTIISIYSLYFITIGNELSLPRIIEDSNTWFCIVITIAYILFYILGKIFKKHNLKIVTSFFLICSIWILIAHHFNFGSNWYHSCYSLVLGMIYSLSEEKILKITKKHYFFTTISSVLLFLLTFLVGFISLQLEKVSGIISLASNQVMGWLWVSVLLLISLKIKSNSNILTFLGKYSYEIYMIHGLFILIFKKINNYLLFNILVFICSIISSVVLHNLFSFLLEKLKKTKLKI